MDLSLTIVYSSVIFQPVKALSNFNIPNLELYSSIVLYWPVVILNNNKPSNWWLYVVVLIEKNIFWLSLGLTTYNHNEILTELAKNAWSDNA